MTQKTLVSFPNVPRIQKLTPLKSQKREDFETITGFSASIDVCPSLGDDKPRLSLLRGYLEWMIDRWGGVEGGIIIHGDLVATTGETGVCS